MVNHEIFMRECIVLAKKGIMNVSPNPMVGCVIVYKDKIISSGYHKEYGGNHAEVNAIENSIDKKILSKSTLYVNLEPCSHYGQTPPCCNLIVKYNIPNVVIGTEDPCSLVKGNGIKYLIENKVNVICGILENKCKKLNKRFFIYQKNKRPYIILKWAKSKDGYIAPKDQEKSFWMTSNKSKKKVHKWRSEEDSILVGTKTVVKDNPELTVREISGKNPIRIVIDRDLSLDLKRKIFNQQSETIIFNDKINLTTKNLIYVKSDFKNLVEDILNKLYNLKIISLIVEGGKYTIDKFISSNNWDEARVFTSEKTLITGIMSPTIKCNPSKTKNIDSDKLDIYFND